MTTITPPELVEWAERQMAQKRTWLECHGPSSKRPRPEHESDNKLHDIAMLEAVVALCKGRAAA
ncbi:MULTISPECIES: hypothetical protein [Sinorhizobium]|uniref:hypothetical protein n=1 Tax=Sinorhizobium TaxID=28105 RepID=UPI000BE87F36|nr:MULTISPECIES: hypothetical protein [Sinorhizobium]PDT55060.1 hypothetical protein CO664_08305 [Sinorhizobium sp. NG07B]POH32101.1 hypothetical protein ATY30_11925 [Sinorhizobium americanum]